MTLEIDWDRLRRCRQCPPWTSSPRHARVSIARHRTDVQHRSSCSTVQPFAVKQTTHKRRGRFDFPIVSSFHQYLCYCGQVHFIGDRLERIAPNSFFLTLIIIHCIRNHFIYQLKHIRPTNETKKFYHEQCEQWIAESGAQRAIKWNPNVSVWEILETVQNKLCII